MKYHLILPKITVEWKITEKSGFYFDIQFDNIFFKFSFIYQGSNFKIVKLDVWRGCTACTTNISHIRIDPYVQFLTLY